MTEGSNGAKERVSLFEFSGDRIIFHEQHETGAAVHRAVGLTECDSATDRLLFACAFLLRNIAVSTNATAQQLADLAQRQPAASPQAEALLEKATSMLAGLKSSVGGAPHVTEAR